MALLVCIVCVHISASAFDNVSLCILVRASTSMSLCMLVCEIYNHVCLHLSLHELHIIAVTLLFVFKTFIV